MENQSEISGTNRSSTWGRCAGLLCGAALVGCGQGDPGQTDLTESAPALVESETPDLEDVLPVGTEVAALEQRSVAGQPFTFVKHVDEHGEIGELILDAEGNPVSRSELPATAPEPIGRSLQAVLDGRPGDRGFYDDFDWIEVVVALRETASATTDPGPIESSTAEIDDLGDARISINGMPVSDEELAASNRVKQARIDARLVRLSEERAAAWRELGEREESLANHPAVLDAIARGDASATLPLEKAAIEDFLFDNYDIVAGLDLHSEAVDLLAAAMQSTTVNPWAINYAERRGSGVGVYMSEDGCPDANHITNYKRLSGASSFHSMNVSSIVRGVSPESYLYCRVGFTLPSAADLLGYDGRPRVHVETHSWGKVQSDNDDYQIIDRDFDNHVYDTGVAVFTSNGNFGNNNGYTGSPAKALNVISVGNYDDANNTINPSSSYRNSEIGNEKPELVAPGTSICAGGVCMTGTSQAAPHAAGFAADLMGAYTWLQLKPHFLKAFMLAGSDRSINGGTDKVGVGGLDFYRNYYNGAVHSWEGANNTFAYFDSIDYLPNNGSIDRQVFLDAAQTNVRVVLSWLNRGTFTYDHRNDVDAIGMDLDICVFGPNDATVWCSSSWDNPYELVSFDPTLTGNYRVSITRFANRDTESKLHMGLSMDWN